MYDESAIHDHMEVVGADGRHVGTVDEVQDDHTLKLTRSDPAADGHHHVIPMDWVSEVEGDRVRLSMPSSEVQRQWRAD
jgi:hypothetical protein